MGVRSRSSVLLGMTERCAIILFCLIVGLLVIFISSFARFGYSGREVGEEVEEGRVVSCV